MPRLYPPPDPRPIDRTARELVGTIGHIVWEAGEDDDSGAVIARLVTGETIKGEQIAEDRLERGCPYRFLGKWEDHHTYKMQFRFETYTREQPETRWGTVRYLMKFAPGIGEMKANRLWEAFGAGAIRVLREEPERCVGPGLLYSIEQAREASLALHQEGAFEETKVELYGLFSGRGFPGSLIKACIARWGRQAGKMVRANPYGLMVRGMPGCGFRRTDKLFIDLGGNSASLKRIMLAGWHHLHTDSSGHTWFAIRDFERAAMKLVPAADRLKIAQAVRLGKRAGWLATRRDGQNGLWVAEGQHAKNERAVADMIRELRCWKDVLWPTADSLPITHVKGDGGLTEHQHLIVQRALVQPVGILAGTPGTGKTYVTAAIIREVVGRLGPGCIGVCAPTGKAAVRVSAAMARYGLSLEATTIHRLLGITRNGHDGKGWGFRFNEHFPLPYKVVIVDEWSMGDTDLAAALLRACAPGTHILFVGDPFQLPPVGHGAPLRDLIAGGIPCGELTEIQRNAGMIVHACKAIKDGQPFKTCDRFNPDAGENLRLIEAASPAETIDHIKAVLARFRLSGKFDPIWDVQIIVAVNKKSLLSRCELNGILQAELNADGAREKGNPFRVGDKIICLKNSSMTLIMAREGCRRDSPRVDDYQDVSGAEQVFLANGEVGKVLAVGPGKVVAAFPLPERIIRIPVGKVKDQDGDGEEDPEGDSKGGNEKEERGKGCNFDLAYAITVHKAQGSEAPVIICPIDDHPGAKWVCTREWVYTALSRASKLCILIGNRGTMDQHCKRVALKKRRTFLADMLQEGRK